MSKSTRDSRNTQTIVGHASNTPWATRGPWTTSLTWENKHIWLYHNIDWEKGKKPLSTLWEIIGSSF